MPLKDEETAHLNKILCNSMCAFIPEHLVLIDGASCHPDEPWQLSLSKARIDGPERPERPCSPVSKQLETTRPDFHLVPPGPTLLLLFLL